MKPENMSQPKVLQMYKAVYELVGEGMDLNKIKVVDITEKAGIGKGTAYEYFDSKEEILFYALLNILDHMGKDILQQFHSMTSFYDKMAYLFKHMQEDCTNSEVVVRLITFAMSPANGETFGKFHAEMRKNKTEERKVEDISNRMNHFPFLLVYQPVVEARESGEITDQFPVSYIANSIMGKIMILTTYRDHPEGEKDCSREQMRDLFLQSIRKEFGISV